MISLERPLFETLEVPQGWPLNPALRWPTAVWVASEWLRTRLVSESASLAGATAPTKVMTARGWAASIATGTGNRIQLAADGDTLFPSTTQATIAVLRRSRDPTARNSTLFGYNAGSYDRVMTNAPYGSGNLLWDFGSTVTGAGGGRLSVAFTKSTSWETLVFVAGGGKGREVWRNGVKIGSDTSANASRATTSSAFNIGSADASGASDNDDVALLVISAVAWSDAECRAWCANPFAATLAPRLEWLPDAASGTTYNVDSAESLSGAAAVQALLAAAAAADVSLSATDAASTSLTTADAIAQSASISEAYAAAVTQLVDLIETLGPDATQDAVLAVAAAVAQALSASESQAAQLDATGAVAEALSPAAAQDAQLTAAAAAAESLSPSETQDTSPQVFADAAETAVTSEALAAVTSLVAAIAEAGSLSEAQTTAAEMVALITETATASDEVAALSNITYNVSIAELAAATAAVTAALVGGDVVLGALTAHRLAMTARVGGRPPQVSSGRRRN